MFLTIICFPFFFVFVAYGPFVPAEERLDILLMDNKHKKKGEGTRAELRKRDAKERQLDAKNDTASQRGFSTEQCLEIEALDLQKQTMVERKNDSLLVGLSIEQCALKDQVEAAERRAASRCPEYNPSNLYWRKVDSLLEDQDKLLDKIRSFNQDMMVQTDKPKESVSVDLISPQKNKAIFASEEGDDVRTCNDIGGDDDSSTGSEDSVTKK